MQNKTKTKLWIVLILTTLVIGGGLAGYVGQEGLFKGLFFGSSGPLPSGDDITTSSSLATGGGAGINMPAGTSTSVGTFQPVADGGSSGSLPSTTGATGTQSVTGNVSYNCEDYSSHNSCIAYTECLWDVIDSGGTCMDPTPESPTGPEPVLEVGKDISLLNSTILRGANNVLVGAFKLKNISSSTIEVDAIMFRKNTPGGSSYLLDNQYLSNIKIYDDGREITGGYGGRLEQEDGGDNLISFSGGRSSNLFTIIHGGTKNINIRADISGLAPVGKKFRFELLENSIRTNNPARTRLAPGNTLPIRSASFTIGAGTAVPEPAAINCSTYTGQSRCTIGSPPSTVCYWHPQPGAANGGTCSDQPLPETGCDTHPNEMSCNMDTTNECHWETNTAYGAMCLDGPVSPPPAAPTMTVTLATDTPAAREVNTGEFFEATKINFTVNSGTILVPSIVVDAKNITGANALPPNKIDKIQLCTSNAGGTIDACSAEYDFNAAGTTVGMTFGTSTWRILNTQPKTLVIKAKLKTDADAGKSFALGILNSNSMDLDGVDSATINGSFPIWGREMTVVTPLVCTGGRNNVDGICVCPAPLFEYVGGTAGTHYSPSACIPCTAAELITAGGFYCPRDLPAQPITCNSLSIAPDGFPSNNPTQNFTAIVEPASFTGTVTWTHLKNGSSVETKTGRQALFPRLDATSVITANARPETSGRICSDQVMAGAPVVTDNLPVDDGGGGRYVRINRGGYDVGFDQTGAAPIQPASTNSTNVSAPAAAPAAPAAPDLSSSQRLRSAPERGNTGPSAVIYVIAMAGVYGSRALRRKFKGKNW